MRHTKGKRNRVRSHHALKPARFGACGHCGVAALAQGTTLSGAPRLALHPFWFERDP